ncbi:hypothetical protein K431DRAFT_17938 [Polychaeton citri CBS 116435]|uniref:Uncharacterized protein n=1 Tax=Polychaeton citri CBS 116435 TaxID=1314669 RepID=A0A9P4QF57_9PEZI|nr:hypothetical protein K431DRAFT_17938 [Polychaeton citri CBS 116435]
MGGTYRQRARGKTDRRQAGSRLPARSSSFIAITGRPYANAACGSMCGHHRHLSQHSCSCCSRRPCSHVRHTRDLFAAAADIKSGDPESNEVFWPPPLSNPLVIMMITARCENGSDGGRGGGCLARLPLLLLLILIIIIIIIVVVLKGRSVCMHRRMSRSPGPPGPAPRASFHQSRLTL